MLGEPLNDEDCLALAMAHVVAAIARTDVRELAARLGSLRRVVRYLRRLPQKDDGADDTTAGPRIACDVPQRVRLPASNPNCLERALLYLALAELIDPRPVRHLVTIEIVGPRGRERHTFPIENGRPVCLDPIVPSHALDAGLHLVRNARGESTGPLSRLGSLRWAVDLVGDAVKNKDVMAAVRHSRAARDVDRIARGLLPVEPATLSWALKAAVPILVPYGSTGIAALEAASSLLDELAGPPPTDSATAPTDSLEAPVHGGQR